jgi:hypothetical protein
LFSNTSFHVIRSRITWFALSLLLSLSAVLAQTPRNRMEILGTVKDSTGAVVPKVDIQIFSPEGKRLASTSSNEEGAFRLSIPRLDEAVVKLSHKGFKLFVAHIHGSSGPLQPIAAVLEIADLSQQIEVSEGSEAGPASTDPAENRDAAVVNENMLERLPVFDQDYVSTLSSFLDQGSVGTMGTTIVVDGMEQKDAGVTPSAVESVKINNDPYSAEFSRPGRGRIEITTKTPDPVYHGTFNFIFRDHNLDARNAFASVRPPEQRRIFEGVLTGPLVKTKRTFFLMSADYQQDDLQSIVFAQLPSGLLQENVPSPVRAKDLAARITHDFSEKHTSTLQFTYEGDSRQNQLSSGRALTAASNPNGGGSGQNRASGGYVLPEAGRSIASIERHLKYSDKLVLSPGLLNQFQIMYERNRDSTSSTTEQRQIAVQNAFVSGGAQATQLATENNVDIRDVLTWSHNAHTVTTGVAIPNMSRRGLDDYSNRLGSFNFATLQDYMDRRPYSFAQQQGPVHFVYWQREVGAFVQDQIRVSSNLQLSVGIRWDWQNYLHDWNNFAPRASVAYAFGKERKTVLRVGGGVFYDRTSARPLGNLALYSAPAVESILLLNPAYPNPFINGIVPSAQPPNLYRFSPNIRTPYLALYSLAIERQVFKSATVAATYRGLVGVSLFSSLNVNQPLPPFFLVRPNPNYGVYQQVQSSGRQVSQALDLSFSGKINRYLSGIAQYTLSRTNNNTAGINYIPPNTYDLNGEYGRADFDQRHRFNMLIDSSPSKWVDLGIGFTAASGLPYTLTLGEDIYNSGFNTARPPGVSRNMLQGPGYAEFDMRWSHDFFLSRKANEGPTATLAVDAFNLPNRVNLSQFIGNEKSPFFGQAVSALPARRLQFTIRLKF